MKVLVFGKTGQVATELSLLKDPDLSCTFLGRAEADLTNPAACADAIRHADVDAVLNAAAYTNVDGAETDEDTARAVNATAPAQMATACHARGIPFLHISTDFVFDGTQGGPYQTTDTPQPINAYGRTKLEGELGVRASGARHVILRTAWVFSAHGSNFVKAMLSLSQKQETLRVVADQVGGPTHAGAIARASVVMLRALLEGHSGGTYHFTGGPDISRADFARKIFNLAALATGVTDIPTTEFPTPANRPLNSRLDCRETWSGFALEQPDWIADLTQVITQLKQGQTA